MLTLGFKENAEQITAWIFKERRTIVDFGGRTGVANYDMERRSVEMAQEAGILKQ